MRKALSILLLVLLGFASSVPLFAAGTRSDDGVPLCCRRNGAHHCMMGMADGGKAGGGGQQFRAAAGSCPYCPASLAVVHGSVMLAPGAYTLSAGLVRQLCGQAQTERKWRIARDRSRQKRGPPAV